MSVYVDDMRAEYRRMKMCHMVADTHDELLVMADRIGVARRWLQAPMTAREHFDICMSKRAKAVACGAIEVTKRDVAMLVRKKRENTSPERGEGEL